MSELLKEWILNLTLFSLLSSLITKLIPGKGYVSYVKIFCGIMMILILFQPLLRITGLEDKFDLHLFEEIYEIERRQMENELIRVEEKQKEEFENRYQAYLEEQTDGMEKEN